MLIAKGGDTISMMGLMFLFKTGLGWDDSRDQRRPTSPGLHAWNKHVAECTRDVEWTHTHSTASQPTTTGGTKSGRSHLFGCTRRSSLIQFRHTLMASSRTNEATETMMNITHDTMKSPKPEPSTARRSSMVTGYTWPYSKNRIPLSCELNRSRKRERPMTNRRIKDIHNSLEPTPHVQQGSNLHLVVLEYFLIRAGLMRKFRKAWLPYFWRSGQRDTRIEEFNEEVGGWLPLLPEVAVPQLTEMLADVVHRKSATAGSLDGWGWRELKVLPVAWYDGLARILTIG